MPNATYLTDNFLIAMPGLNDPNFAQTLTYICEHSADGALGIIVNRPTKIRLSDILEQMELKHPVQPQWDVPIYAGGPVGNERGFVIHTGPDKYNTTLQVTEQIHITTSRDILLAISLGEGPAEYLVALGYAGWGAGQLEQEIRDNAWLCVKANKRLLFHTPAEQRLAAAAGLLGIELASLTGDMGHA